MSDPILQTAALPAESLVCVRLAAALILATLAAPDHPLVLAAAADLEHTCTLIDSLLERAHQDPELRARAAELAGQWSREARRLGLRGRGAELRAERRQR